MSPAALDADLRAKLESVRVESAVFALRPDFVTLLVAAAGLPGGPSDSASRAALHEAAQSMPGGGATDHPHVVAWREAYRAFGAKPNRTRCSVEALLRRVPAGLPEVNRLVDLYNAVSVRHVLPVGGEDLDAYIGPARLVRAVGDERFDTVADGEPAVDHPEPGEVVWRDDAGVTCRRWNWRQCVRTQLTENTRRALFVLERLAPMRLEALVSAGDDLAERLRGLNAEVRVATRLVRAGPE